MEKMNKNELDAYYRQKREDLRRQKQEELRRQKEELDKLYKQQLKELDEQEKEMNEYSIKWFRKVLPIVRAYLGITMRVLSKKVGVNETYFCKYESGTKEITVVKYYGIRYFLEVNYGPLATRLFYYFVDRRDISDADKDAMIKELTDFIHSFPTLKGITELANELNEVYPLSKISERLNCNKEK